MRRNIINKITGCLLAMAIACSMFMAQGMETQAAEIAGVPDVQKYLAQSTQMAVEEMKKELYNDKSTTTYKMQNRQSTTDTIIPLILQDVTWEAAYDQALANELATQLAKIPVPILMRFYQVGGHFVMKQEGTLGDGFSGTTDSSFDAKSGLLVESTIYLTAKDSCIKSSTVHEMGHFVYGDIWGYYGDYSLLQYSILSQNAQDTAVAAGQVSYNAGFANNSQYLMSSKYEYFAGVFAYVCNFGSNEAYLDTMDMASIITMYKSYLVSAKLIWLQ